MRLAIRWKLMGSYLLLLLLTVAAVYAYLRPSLERQLVDGLRDNLRSGAELAAWVVEREVAVAGRAAPEVAAEIGERLRARVTIMAADGVVIGDSEVPPSALGNLDNHGDRPEMREALQGQAGSILRYSTTLDTKMLYVAVPAPTAAGAPLVVRLALPLPVIDQARAGLHAVLGAALLISALLALALSYLLSHVASRTLRELTAGAVRFGAGDFGTRVAVRSRDELGELAQVMNDMAARLDKELMRLAAERNRLDAILRGMGEGLLVTDGAGGVALVNPAFRCLFAIDDDPVGRPLAEVCRHPVLLDTFRRVMESRHEQTVEIVLPRPGEVTLLTHCVPLGGGETSVGVVAVMHDISNLKRLERVRRDFVANVSHELRTPVTVIRGYAETLVGSAADPELSRRFAATIQAHAERLTALIGDLLALSELEDKGTTLTLAPVRLDEVVRHCCALVEPQADRRRVSLAADGVSQLTVLADRPRLEQVLVNLLDNAVKFSPAGGQVTMDAVAQGELVRVSVRDTGPGIPLHEQSRIFERFYRVDAGRSREQGGTGLGLAIVKHIVQLHGGSVGVESIPGAGANFFFTLRRG